VKWRADTSSVFTIGILSNNQILIDKFNELAKIAKINKKRILTIFFPNLNSIQPTHILYVDHSYNQSFPFIINKISKQNTLLVSEEHNQPGEIMINLLFDPKTSVYTFEYNRASILFAGLELTDEVILLKGTEIEIRELYLQAKRLWDDQQASVAELKKQSDLQYKNIAAKNDSIYRMKIIIDSNRAEISKQIYFLAQKDTLSNNLNNKIGIQQAELNRNLRITEKLILGQNAGKELIRKQLALSDSLSSLNNKKQIELVERNRALGEKESLIHRQLAWLIILVSIILIVTTSIIFISRAYIINRRDKQKIAEQKEALETMLEQLKSAQQQLIQSEKMASLGVFISGIAHEINNPVNFISTGIEGIEKTIEKVNLLSAAINSLTTESKGEEIQKLIDLKQELKFQRSLDAVPELLANIRIGITRTIGISNGLRLYARLDTEGKSLCDINQIIDTALLLIKPQINSELDIQKHYGELQQVAIFPGKLSQVFVNILSNAIDSIQSADNQPEKHTISITTGQKGGTIFLKFSDTGKGIPEEVLPKIFDPFYTTKKVGKGTGLGMSISLSIIEEHNGKIYARNNISRGATFTIEIPVNNE
jgi:signal transduction histidine kinase